MLRYCFCEEKLHRVFLRAFASNSQAIRSYEKAGFEREAYLREDVCIDGQYRDIVLMGILDPKGTLREERL
jgi:RimJ/RimL family protein N-acetyltransferase